MARCEGIRNRKHHLGFVTNIFRSSNGSFYTRPYESTSFPTAVPPRPGVPFQPTARVENRYNGPDDIASPLGPNSSVLPLPTDIPSDKQRGIFLFDQIDGLPEPWMKPPTPPPRSPRRLTPKQDTGYEEATGGGSDVARTPLEYYTGQLNEDGVSATSDSNSSTYSRDTNGNGIISGVGGYPELEISPLEDAPPPLRIRNKKRRGPSQPVGQEPAAGRPYAPTPQTSDENAVPSATADADPEQWRTRRLTIENAADALRVQPSQPPTLVTAKNRMVPLLGVPEPKSASGKPSRLYDISNPFKR